MPTFHLLFVQLHDFSLDNCAIRFNRFWEIFAKLYERSVFDMNRKHPLKAAIEKRGYTVNQLAAKADVPVSNLYAVIRGRSKFENMGVGSVIRIAQALDTTVDDLAEEVRYYCIDLEDDED